MKDRLHIIVAAASDWYSTWAASLILSLLKGHYTVLEETIQSAISHRYLALKSFRIAPLTLKPTLIISISRGIANPFARPFTSALAHGGGRGPRVLMDHCRRASLRPLMSVGRTSYG